MRKGRGLVIDGGLCDWDWAIDDVVWHGVGGVGEFGMLQVFRRFFFFINLGLTTSTTLCVMPRKQVNMH